MKGLKRVSKGSARIYVVSSIHSRVRHGTYHGLERVLPLLFARFSLILAFLSFWWHSRTDRVCYEMSCRGAAWIAGKKLVESRPAVMSYR